MALREIAAHFGFSVDKRKLDDIDKGVNKVKASTESATTGVEFMVTAFQGLVGLQLVQMTREWVTSLASAADELGSNAEATGLSARELQIWSLGAAQAGEDASVFTAALKSLSKAVGGGKDEMGTQAAAFKEMGIETKNSAKELRPLGDILPDIAEHFRQMENGTQKAILAQNLFGRSGSKLIPLLNKGAAGIAELTKTFDELGGGFDAEAIARAGEMKVAIANVNMVMTSLKSQLAIGILPRFATLLQYISKGVGWLTDFSHQTTLVASAVGALSTALVVTLGGALAPYIGGAMKFTAIYLAVDDLKGFLEGENSAIGAILNAWFGDGTAVVVREWCLDAFTTFTNTFQDLTVVLPVFGNAFMAVIFGMAQGFNEFVLGVQEKWNGLIDSLGLNDRFKVDTKFMAEQAASAKQSTDHYTQKQYAAEQVVQKYAKDATPLAQQTNIVTAPFNTATATTPAQQSWNMVQSAPQIQINVAAGTPQQQTEALGRQTREALRDSHRQALQTLENRK